MSEQGPEQGGPELKLDFSREGATEIIQSVIDPTRPDQVAIFGPRGEGKTATVLGSMIAHAQQHQALGFKLPTRWLGVADTLKAHKAKTHASLMDEMWAGCWRIEESGELAVFREPGGVDMVHLRLTGVEDQAGVDRVRTQMHGLWFEEPAPAAVMVQSSGLTDTAWGTGITSCRLKSYRNPKIMTLNLPDEEHWTAQLFVFAACPSCGVVPRETERMLPNGTKVGACRHRRYILMKPKERTTARDHEDWMAALAGRPDMQRRLLAGEFGSIVQGPQVAAGFTRERYVRPCRPVRGVPVYIGQDGGNHQAAVIGQRVDGHVRILAGLALPKEQQMGSEQFVEYILRPWLLDNMPWALDLPLDDALLHVIYDPSMDKGAEGDITVNAVHVMRRKLPARYEPGPVKWDPRKDALLRLINLQVGAQPMLQVDPACKALITALDGAWYYAQAPNGQLKKADTQGDSVQPYKPNAPAADLGDALCYLAYGLKLGRPERPQGWTPKPSALAFSPYKFQQAKQRAKTGFNPYTVVR